MATIDSFQADERATDEQEPTRSGVVWTGLASAALVVASAALAVVPRVLPSETAIVARLAKHGLTWPLLACVGLVLGAIAATALKKTPKPQPEPRPEPETMAPVPDPMLREIAAELARVRGGLHDMRVDFVYVKDALSRLQQSATHVEDNGNAETEAAIFRLAASLDQLGGRVEHELHAQRSWIAAALEQRGTASMSSGRGSGESTPAYADPYASGFEGPVHEINLDEGFVSAEGDMHVEVSLEDEGGWPRGLGVLDQLDDLPGPLSHGKKSPSANPSRTIGLLGELEHGIAARGAVDTKMARLRELLSDPEVQQAIDRSQY